MRNQPSNFQHGDLAPQRRLQNLKGRDPRRNAALDCSGCPNRPNNSSSTATEEVPISLEVRPSPHRSHPTCQADDVYHQYHQARTEQHPQVNPAQNAKHMFCFYCVERRRRRDSTLKQQLHAKNASTVLERLLWVYHLQLKCLETKTSPPEKHAQLKHSTTRKHVSA